MADLYGELGVGRDASEADIRKAYRRKAKRAHPDGGGSAEAFAKLSRALTVLSDPKARAHYDATGEIEERAVDNRDADALNVLAACFGRVMAQMQAGVPVRDFIAAMRRDLLSRKGQWAEAKAKAERDLAGQARFAKRFRAANGQNWLETFALKAAEPLRQQARQAENELRALGAALDLLKNFSDAEAVQVAMSGTDRRFASNPMGGMGRMW